MTLECVHICAVCSAHSTYHVEGLVSQILRLQLFQNACGLLRVRAVFRGGKRGRGGPWCGSGSGRGKSGDRAAVSERFCVVFVSVDACVFRKVDVWVRGCVYKTVGAESSECL